ncbi:hypothetical protein AVEN_234525-1 [Araneus ventricosus]|uniref:MULE transposase domain-containing protein n=1 Tax=Araneus ventricosus TaxID=182803 RepID=A0A4Y2A8S9_ARAVE|nr:hypothetical protein AVEN_234525-1 [Araneus ventricosus]
MQPLFNKGYDFVTNIPNFISVKTYFYVGRRKAQGEEREPKTAAEIDISEDVTKMEDGTNFLLADVCGEGRMLVFATEDGKNVLKNYKTFFVDGSFKSSSEQFKQLYSVHVGIGSSSDEINITAATYALLSRKDTSMYDRLFSILKNEAEWNPDTVIMDFEEAATIALCRTFPNVKINGCNFHFTQSLWEYIQELQG